MEQKQLYYKFNNKYYCVYKGTVLCYRGSEWRKVQPNAQLTASSILRYERQLSEQFLLEQGIPLYIGD